MPLKSICPVCGSDYPISPFWSFFLHKGSQPVNAIGRKVLLASGSITAAIDRLSLRGLVERTPDPGDARTRIVRLTESGRKLIEQAFSQHAQDMEETMAVLKPAERTELVRLLKKVGLWAAARLWRRV